MPSPLRSRHFDSETRRRVMAKLTSSKRSSRSSLNLHVRQGASPLYPQEQDANAPLMENASNQSEYRTELREGPDLNDSRVHAQDTDRDNVETAIFLVTTQKAVQSETQGNTRTEQCLTIGESRNDNDLNDADHYDFPTDFQEFPTYFQAESTQRVPPDQSLPYSPQRSRTPSQQAARSEMISLKRSLSDIGGKKQLRSSLIVSAHWRGRMTKKYNQKDIAKTPESIKAIPTTSLLVSTSEKVPVAISLERKGVMCLKQGRLVVARQALIDALALKRKLSPGVMVADIINNIGNCSNLMGRYGESLDYYKHALENLCHHSGPTSNMALYAHCLFNIGRAEVQRKQWDAAMTILSEAWRSAREAFGETHVFVAQALDLLGFVQFSTSEMKSAVVSFKGALQIYRKVHGDNHEDVANSMCNIGLVREVKGDYENAWACYSKSEEIYERLGTSPHDQGYECARACVQRMEQTLKEKALNRRKISETAMVRGMMRRTNKIGFV